MQFLRRSLVGLLLLSVTAGLLAMAGATLWSAVQERMAQEPRDRPARERVMAVETVAVTSERVSPVLTVFGQIDSRRRLELRTPSAGRVIALAPGFEDGAMVAAGDLLLQIDPRDAEAGLDVARTDLAEAEAELRDAERSLALARDELVAARAQADLRAQALARQRDLEDRGVGTAATVEEAALAESAAQQAVLTRRIAVANAESRVDQARNGVARAGIALENARRDLDDTEMRAEFSGTLADVTVTAGGLVAANERIATLIDPEALEVAFRVSTAQYARLLDARGQIVSAPVRVTLDVLGLDLEARGVITRVGADVGAGQTGRRIFARLDSFAGFRPGDFVSVHVEEPPLDDVARLPATAVDASGTVLAIGSEERLQVVDTTILRRQGDSVLVPAAGLEGRRVVANRTPLLGPGIKVRDLGAERDEQRDLAAASAAATDDRIALTAERRAALIAAVEARDDMPDEAKARILAQLGEGTVPAGLVARIESRMGG
jgi:multidrug efflux pump subunit AcrA (membrane-fusion protein)